MKNIYTAFAFLFMAATILGANFTLAADSITLCGDSTVATYPSGTRQGWGAKISGYTALGVSVNNQAIGGRSSTTFLSEGRWKKALALKTKYIFIQFGHNDEGKKESIAGTTFKANLQLMINDAKKQNAIAVLVTPPHRLIFTDAQHLSTELEPYAKAMRDLAIQNKIPLIDLQAATARTYIKLGESASLKYFVPGDRTHTVSSGASLIAQMVATEAKLNASLRSLFK